MSKLSSRQWSLLVFTMFVICWSMGLITFATFMVFTDMGAVSGSVATTYTGLLGILSTLTGFMAKKVKEFYE